MQENMGIMGNMRNMGIMLSVDTLEKHIIILKS